YDEFAEALDDLLSHPEAWRQRGQKGQVYVQTHYGSEEKFAQVLQTAIADLALPWSERMRKRGPERAAEFDRAVWREQFGRLIDHLLHEPRREHQEVVDVRPRTPERTVTAGMRNVLVPVRVSNRGTLPLLPDGPARRVLTCTVLDEAGRAEPLFSEETLLPGLLVPGRALSAAVSVPVPTMPRNYRVRFYVR